MADCAETGRKPRVLPHDSERLQCLTRNHSASCTSLKAGRLITSLILELLEPVSLFAVYHIERIFVSLSKEKIRS